MKVIEGLKLKGVVGGLSNATKKAAAACSLGVGGLGTKVLNASQLSAVSGHLDALTTVARLHGKHARFALTSATTGANAAAKISNAIGVTNAAIVSAHRNVTQTKEQFVKAARDAGLAQATITQATLGAGVVGHTLSHVATEAGGLASKTYGFAKQLINPAKAAPIVPGTEPTSSACCLNFRPYHSDPGVEGVSNDTEKHIVLCQRLCNKKLDGSEFLANDVNAMSLGLAHKEDGLAEQAEVTISEICAEGVAPQSGAMPLFEKSRPSILPGGIDTPTASENGPTQEGQQPDIADGQGKYKTFRPIGYPSGKDGKEFLKYLQHGDLRGFNVSRESDGFSSLVCTGVDGETYAHNGPWYGASLDGLNDGARGGCMTNFSVDDWLCWHATSPSANGEMKFTVVVCETSDLATDAAKSNDLTRGVIADNTAEEFKIILVKTATATFVTPEARMHEDETHVYDLVKDIADSVVHNDQIDNAARGNPDIVSHFPPQQTHIVKEAFGLQVVADNAPEENFDGTAGAYSASIELADDDASRPVPSPGVFTSIESRTRLQLNVTIDSGKRLHVILIPEDSKLSNPMAGPSGWAKLPKSEWVQAANYVDNAGAQTVPVTYTLKDLLIGVGPTHFHSCGAHPAFGGIVAADIFDKSDTPKMAYVTGTLGATGTNASLERQSWVAHSKLPIISHKGGAVGGRPRRIGRPGWYAGVFLGKSQTLAFDGSIRINENHETAEGMHLTAAVSFSADHKKAGQIKMAHLGKWVPATPFASVEGKIEPTRTGQDKTGKLVDNWGLSAYAHLEKEMPGPTEWEHIREDVFNKTGITIAATPALFAYESFNRDIHGGLSKQEMLTAMVASVLAGRTEATASEV